MKRKTRQNLSPAEGAVLRAEYRRFMGKRGGKRGLPISFKDTAGRGWVIGYLRKVYGFNIIRLGDQSYRLAGRWIGGAYVAYKLPKPKKSPPPKKVARGRVKAKPLSKRAAAIIRWALAAKRQAQNGRSEISAGAGPSSSGSSGFL